MTDRTDDKQKSSGDFRSRATFFDQLVRLSIGAGIIISLATALRPLALFWWVADNFCHFAVQYVILLAPVVLLVSVARKWKTAAVFSIVLSVNLCVIWSYLPPYWQSDPAPKAGKFRLMIQNVQTGNQNHQLLIDLVTKEQPDILILFEIDQKWVDSLTPLHAKYPYRKTANHPGNFGIGIISRHPWKSCETKNTGPDQLPTIFAKWQDAHGSLEIVGTHPVPPLNGRQANSRNIQLLENLKALAPTTSDYEGIKILAGDFNLTPWSPWFQKLLVDPYRGMGRFVIRGDEGAVETIRSFRFPFVDASMGFDIRPTWNCFSTILGGVKIDHVLIHSDLGVSDYRIGSDIGSDHRAVVVDIEGEVPN